MNPMLEVALIEGGVILLLGGVIVFLVRRHRRALAAEQDVARTQATRLELTTMEMTTMATDAERASHAKSEFLAMMSHELRTPLTAIIGYTEIMEMGIFGPVSDEQRQVHGRIMHSGEHLLNLINGILDYAKVEAGHRTVHLQPVLLRLKVEAAREALDPQLTAKHLSLNCTWETTNTWVLGDGDAIKQILLNLLSNAIKFTPEWGHIDIRVRADGGRLIVAVQDTGVGVPQNRLGVIFDPFVQAEATMTRQYGGTGLGLAISRQLARSMRGDLTGESEPGKGSIFTLTLLRDTSMEAGLSEISPSVYNNQARVLSSGEGHDATGSAT
jgi:signal transduction histidine kinase